MAKLKGIIKIEGTLQDMTFYKTQDGHLVKTKSGVSADRIANDPSFVRTRENGAEFGSSATAGKLVRDTFRILLQNASDNRVTSRLTQLMTQLKNLDSTSQRGQRLVSLGIQTPEGINLVKAFNFNNKSILGSILFAPYTVDTSTGIISIPNLTPAFDVKNVPGATHVAILGAYGALNFDSGDGDIQFTNAVNLPIDNVSGSVTLTPAGVPTTVGTNFFLLEIIYFQQVNGSQYILNNGAFNALSVIDLITP